jgi:hypothetical protein
MHEFGLAVRRTIEDTDFLCPIFWFNWNRDSLPNGPMAFAGIFRWKQYRLAIHYDSQHVTTQGFTPGMGDLDLTI